MSNIFRVKLTAKVTMYPFLGIVVLLAVSIALIARGYFLEHKLPTSGIGEEELSYNDLLPVANVAGINSKGEVISYGASITDSSKLPNTSGIWLKATSDQATFVGELTTNIFTPKYSLPSNLNELRLFETQEMLYVTKGDISEYSKVIWAGVSTTELLNTRSGDIEYISAYFEPETKDIYAVKKQRDGVLVVELLRISGDIYKLFETRDFGTAEIIKANSVLGEVWMKVDIEGVSTCIRLDLKTKQYASKACIDAYKGVSSYYLARLAHSQNYPGSGDKIVKLFGSSSTEITKAGDAELFSALYWQDNTLSFLKYNITSNGVQLASFEVVDGGSKATLQSDTTPPPMNYPLETAVDSNGNLYLLATLDGIEHIYYKGTSISDTSSTSNSITTTATTSSPSTQEVNGWYDIEIPVCSAGCHFTFLK